MKNENNIKKSLDRALEPLRFTGADQVILKTRWRGTPGRRIKRLMPALAAALLLTAALGAIALGLYSPAYSATKAARQALKDTYGLSDRVLDLFSDWQREQEADGGWQVRFEPYIGNKKAIGIYTVHIDKRGKAQATWSHDDQDPSLYRDGPKSDDLEKEPVWGAKHLEAFFDQRTAQQEKIDEQIRLNAAAPTRVPDPVPAPAPVPAPSMEEQETVKKADQAMRDQLGMSDAVLDLFEPGMLKRQPRTVIYQVKDRNHTLWRNAAAEAFSGQSHVPQRHMDTRFGRYTVTLPSDGEGKAEISWSLEGKEARDFTPSNWGQAEAYGAKLLPWAAELLRKQQEIADKYPLGFNQEEMSLEDRAAHDRLFREAGFPLERYSSALPAENEMNYEQALQAAKTSILQEKETEASLLDEAFVVGSYQMYNHVIDKVEGIWWFTFQLPKGQSTIIMRATDGLIYYLHVDPNESSNG